MLQKNHAVTPISLGLAVVSLVFAVSIGLVLSGVVVILRARVGQ